MCDGHGLGARLVAGPSGRLGAKQRTIGGHERTDDVIGRIERKATPEGLAAETVLAPCGSVSAERPQGKGETKEDRDDAQPEPQRRTTQERLGEQDAAADDEQDVERPGTCLWRRPEDLVDESIQFVRRTVTGEHRDERTGIARDDDDPGRVAPVPITIQMGRCPVRGLACRGWPRLVTDAGHVDTGRCPDRRGRTPVVLDPDPMVVGIHERMTRTQAACFTLATRVLPAEEYGLELTTNAIVRWSVVADAQVGRDQPSTVASAPAPPASRTVASGPG